MAKKQNEKPAAENYYKLEVDAVEKLVNAKDAPEVSEKEIRKYKSGPKFAVPSWVKIVLIKFWCGGSICYFFLWGLGIYIVGIDLLVALAIGLGLVTDLLINNMLHYFEPTKGAYDKWMMITVRKFWSIFPNILYSGVILFCIVQTYTVINTILVGSPDSGAGPVITVEPIFFGLLYVGFDMLFIGIKHVFRKILQDAEKKVSGKK
ncbi:MAG: hypothetical protein ACI4XA_06120 [Oscillospiraceae bacterium]